MLVSPEPETAPQESTCSNLTVWVSLCTLWCRAGLYATTLCPTVPPPPNVIYLGGVIWLTCLCVLSQVQTQLEQVTNKLQTEEEMRQQLAVDFDQVSHNKDILLKLSSNRNIASIQLTW